MKDFLKGDEDTATYIIRKELPLFTAAGLLAVEHKYRNKGRGTKGTNGK